MGYQTIGAEGRVTSWGSANFYSTLLAAITPQSARLVVVGDGQDITGLFTSQTSRIPGLKSATVEITGQVGAAPYLGNRGFVSYSGSEYDSHVYEFDWTCTTPTVYDITEYSSSDSPEWRTFRPDMFDATCRFTAGVDHTDALTLPPDPGASLPTVTLCYKSNGSGTSTASLAAAGLINQLTAQTRVRNKNVATYEILGSGAWTAAGADSIFGARTFAGSSNVDPLWSAGGSAAGQLIFQMASGRTFTCSDSFWTRIALRGRVNAPTEISISVQVTGTVTPA